MNKQELIGKIKSAETLYLSLTPFIGKKLILDLVKQLDEPQKVTIPQFVAGWLNYCKLTGVDLYHAFEMGDLYLGNYAYQKDYSKLKGYFETENNQELFARAWLDGYEVEKEPKYTVKFKATKQYLSNDELGPHFDPSFRSNFTKSDLEKLGLAEVFNSPLFEVEEVENE